MSKQIRRIDTHHHFMPEGYVKALKKAGIDKSAGREFPKWDMDSALGILNSCEIDVAITSISYPGVYFGDIGFAKETARLCNEASMALNNRYPERFGGFASLPLPDVKSAIEEFDYATEKLNLDGVVLPTNIDGVYLGDPSFDELFHEFNKRKTVIYLHPAEPPGKELAKLDSPGWIVDFVFDTTRVVNNLVFSGTMERYPDLRIILSHGGGAVPYLAYRMSLAMVEPEIAAKVPKGVGAYLKRFYYDTALSASPASLSSLRKVADMSHILYGSDVPFAPPVMAQMTTLGLRDYGGFSDSELEQIEYKNSLSLFPQFN